jgi:hypothetical protein
MTRGKTAFSLRSPVPRIRSLLITPDALRESGDSHNGVYHQFPTLHFAFHSYDAMIQCCCGAIPSSLCLLCLCDLFSYVFARSVATKQSHRPPFNTHEREEIASLRSQ